MYIYTERIQAQQIQNKYILEKQQPIYISHTVNKCTNVHNLIHLAAKDGYTPRLLKC